MRHMMDRRYLEGSRETTSWEYMKGVPLLIVWIRRWYSNYLNLISSEAWIRPHSQSLLSVTVAHRLNTTLVFAREGNSILVQSQVKTKLSVVWSKLNLSSPIQSSISYQKVSQSYISDQENQSSWTSLEVNLQGNQRTNLPIHDKMCLYHQWNSSTDYKCFTKFSNVWLRF